MQQRIRDIFREAFGTKPAFVIRGPGRVNLIGEHTDYNDGFVLPGAVDRAIWVALSPRTDRTCHFVSGLGRAPRGRPSGGCQDCDSLGQLPAGHLR